MHKKNIHTFSSIWSTWSLDPLFVIDELVDATKQKAKLKRKECIKQAENKK